MLFIPSNRKKGKHQKRFFFQKFMHILLEKVFLFVENFVLIIDTLDSRDVQSNINFFFQTYIFGFIEIEN
jgi:hypothetical protein